MGRRRWRLITIAGFLLFMTKATECQDENDFYYTPVERSFAQVQPPLYPNNRPPNYFQQDNPYHVSQPTIQSSGQQSVYNEGRIRFPAPNYNQNPSPFQVPSDKSQSGSQYFNQGDFSQSHRQKYRIALPHNYQILHPASTKRPDVSQIHSLAYQNDPSRPEAFLGQVTINNPDIDYLQNNRFKNIPFDGNSLRSVQNHQSISINEDERDQDLFGHHRVTTYNPNKFSNRPRLIKPNPGRFPHYDGDPQLNDKTLLGSIKNNDYIKNNNPNKSQGKVSSYPESSTEYKSMLDLEPLLEDDLSDISFKELMKNNKDSHDVQVIKSNNNDDLDKYDNNPSASSMNTDNVPKEDKISSPSSESYVAKYQDTKVNADSNQNNQSHKTNDSSEDTQKEEDEPEYAEYYDEPDVAEVLHTTTQKPEAISDHAEYEDFDSTEEHESEKEIANEDQESKAEDQEKDNDSESYKNGNNTSAQEFDVLMMKQNNTMVKDDNFNQFVDTTVIDQIEHVSTDSVTESNTEASVSSEEIVTVETPAILGQEVVSVVTTKSVVNGTISVPNINYQLSTAKSSVISNVTPSLHNFLNYSATQSPVTTENWVVVASVQTSRSVSGARFLPFPTVEQEEKKQVLVDEEDDLESVTLNPKEELTTSEILHLASPSTENLNDKLDSIQSELSSAVLSGSLDGENKNIEIITESTSSKQPNTTIQTTTTIAPNTTPINVFTTRTTGITFATERSSPDPLPVNIKKFTPRYTTSTTPRPKKKLVTVMDDLSGLLPPGYKSRMSFKDKRTSTTTTSTTTETLIDLSEEDSLNETQGRSSGISSKNKVIIRDDKNSAVSKDNKIKETKLKDELLSTLQHDDLSKFLPPGYKPPKSDLEDSKDVNKSSIFDKVQQVNISAFLPKAFNFSQVTEKPVLGKKNISITKANDISSLLPPGYKLNTSETEEPDLINKFKVVDVKNLLPPGFVLNNNEKTPETSTTKKTPQSSGGFKPVFPSRLGNKPTRKTTPKPNGEMGPVPVTPKIQKGWPTRASTEFTGWPSPSTTPFSIEKLLEAQRNATATSPMPEISTEATTRRTTTSTTTQPPPPSTTPGTCKNDCDIAATIKLVAGAQWVPELLDHHTDEWQKLAEEVKEELNSVYSKSDLLSKWYKGIRIEGFTQGSVLVDYFIELNNVDKKVNTLELKKLFHKSLNEILADSKSVEEKVQDLDSDVMLGDQPDEERMKKSNEKMTKTFEKYVGKLEMGKFVMDPAYTEFIVLPKREQPTTISPEEESFLPQWGIAVIVIALASLLFVVIFGVTVLVNRQKSTKAKQPIPLSEDMLRELDKSHMGGFDDLHQLKERELPYHSSGKRMSTAFIEQLAYSNPGDSWRSEWTPQLQKYMQQHYTPDSGRGSQIYGATGNGYGGSQIYGQTGGGGSQIYGYTGEYPRSHYSRRRSDYDSNF